MGCDSGSKVNVTNHSKISIHAPRVGCDINDISKTTSNTNFNPRTPCGVRPWTDSLPVSGQQIFQSTHPVWGATINRSTRRIRQRFQSTHPVWGATAMCIYSLIPSIDFNPRTPCGVRPLGFISSFSHISFQSTHPVWGATSWMWICLTGF